jgi:hypothetical protein
MPQYNVPTDLDRYAAETNYLKFCCLIKIARVIACYKFHAIRQNLGRTDVCAEN